jgi:hypothetical protein
MKEEILEGWVAYWEMGQIGVYPLQWDVLGLVQTSFINSNLAVREF